MDAVTPYKFRNYYTMLNITIFRCDLLELNLEGHLRGKMKITNEVKYISGVTLLTISLLKPNK